MFHPLSPFATNTLRLCPFLSALYLYEPFHPSPKPHSPSPPLSCAPFSWPSCRRSHSCFPGTGTQRSLSHSAGLCAVIQPFSGNAIPPCDTAIACIYCYLALMINNGRDDLILFILTSFFDLCPIPLTCLILNWITQRPRVLVCSPSSVH